MKTHKHTPGPWKTYNSFFVHGPDCIVCYVGNPKDQELLRFSVDRWKADARLIAAAPELLETAKRAYELVKAYAPWDLNNHHAFDNLYRAIEKAEGAS